MAGSRPNGVPACKPTQRPYPLAIPLLPCALHFELNRWLAARLRSSAPSAAGYAPGEMEAAPSVRTFSPSSSSSAGARPCLLLAGPASRRRPRPAPSPPPARRWWSPARHRRRPRARPPQRTPRSTAPAASAAPAPPGSSRCEFRFPSFSSYVFRFVSTGAASGLAFGCGSFLEVNRCFRVSCRRMISYAACLEGADVVRLFDRRISARRGQGSSPSASSSCICFKDQLVDLLG